MRLPRLPRPRLPRSTNGVVGVLLVVAGVEVLFGHGPALIVLGAFFLLAAALEAR